MAARLVLGVDGGGSKTVALLADRQGRVLGRGSAGSSNYHAVGAMAAGEALGQAIRAAYAEAGLSPAEQPAHAICLGMAGVERAADRAIFEAWAGAQMPSSQSLIVNDAHLVLAAGTPEGWGVAVISGTGSNVVGRDHEGNTARAGGWGYLLGDEGSGYGIGLEALRAVARAADGRGEPTALARAILENWSLRAPEDLIRQVYRERVPRTEIAALARLVEATAAEGDEVAQRILAQAAEELALAVGAVVRRLGMRGPIPCALAGGVLVHGKIVARLFGEQITARGLPLEPIGLVAEPAVGAVRLARELGE